MAGMPDPIVVSMSDAARDVLITIKVRHQARFWFRMWVMTKLLLLAKFVAPVQVNIESE